jgi:hypothetical protein
VLSVILTTNAAKHFKVLSVILTRKAAKHFEVLSFILTKRQPNLLMCCLLY